MNLAVKMGDDVLGAARKLFVAACIAGGFVAGWKYASRQ